MEDDHVSQGQILAGKFRLLEPLGAGGMGSVWRAEHLTLDATVAVKILDPHLARREVSRRRFLREAKAAAKLRSPHVVQILDQGHEDGVAFICMELLEGESLAQRIRHGKLSSEQTATVMTHIGRAVARAHEIGIVHRDLKPANVFLVDNDGEHVAKVLDFGIAKRSIESLDDADTASVQTAEGAVLGTPHYMSPEQFASSDKVDWRTDLWAMGVIAFECLCGRRPFPGDSIADVVMNVCRRDPPVPSTRSLVPRGFDQWFAKATARQPDARFESARQMVDELADVLADERPFVGIELPSDNESTDVDESLPTATSMRDPTGQMSQGQTADTTLPTVQAAPEQGQDATRDSSPTTAVSPGIDRGKRRMAVWIVVVLAVGVAGFVLISKTLGQAPSETTVANSSATVATSATANKSTPQWSTTNRDAIAAFEKGKLAFKYLRFEEAKAAYRRALELDPHMAEAHVELAAFMARIDRTIARRHLRRGLERLAKLDDKYRMLAEVLQLEILRDPPEYAALKVKLREAIKRFPGDPNFSYLLAAYVSEHDPAEAVRILEPAIAKHPDHILMLTLLAEAQAYAGNLDGVSKAAAACEKAKGPATHCHLIAAMIDQQRGACSRLEKRARTMCAGAPDNFIGHGFLATALAATDTPEPAVRLVLERKWQRLGEPQATRIKGRDEVLLAVAYGHFQKAEQLLRQLAEQVNNTARYEEHARVARLTTKIQLETGQIKKAAQTARAFLDKQYGLDRNTRNEDYAIGSDPQPTLWRALRQAGKLDEADLRQLRKRWLESWKERRVSAQNRPYLWLRGYAAVVLTAEDAKEALKALDDYRPIPSHRPLALYEAHVGRTYLLAGQPDKAIEWLTLATNSCNRLRHPFLHTQSFDWLGASHELNDNKTAACEAYDRVLKRWGQVRNSVTAAHAKKRVAALRCK